MNPAHRQDTPMSGVFLDAKRSKRGTSGYANSFSRLLGIPFLRKVLVVVELHRGFGSTDYFSADTMARATIQSQRSGLDPLL